MKWQLVNLRFRSMLTAPDTWVRLMSTLKLMEVPLLCLSPAATTMMLPVLCDLQTVAVDVLPRMATDLTLDGPTFVSGPQCMPVEAQSSAVILLVPMLTRMLLTTHSGRAFVPTEPLLWTATLTFVLGLFESESIRMFVTWFRSVLTKSAFPDPATLDASSMFSELVMPPPRVLLQLTRMMMPLTRAILRRSLICRLAPSLITTPRGVTLTNEKARMDRRPPMSTVKWFRALAAALSAAFRLTMSVLVTGLLAVVLSMAFAI